MRGNVLFMCRRGAWDLQGSIATHSLACLLAKITLTHPVCRPIWIHLGALLGPLGLILGTFGIHLGPFLGHLRDKLQPLLAEYCSHVAFACHE